MQKLWCGSKIEEDLKANQSHIWKFFRHLEVALWCRIFLFFFLFDDSVQAADLLEMKKSDSQLFYSLMQHNNCIGLTFLWCTISAHISTEPTWSTDQRNQLFSILLSWFFSILRSKTLGPRVSIFFSSIKHQRHPHQHSHWKEIYFGKVWSCTFIAQRSHSPFAYLTYYY